MKKGKFIILIIIFVIIGLVGGYFITLTLDNMRRGGDVNINITLEDSETYTIPSIKKMTNEDALKEWPYIIHFENTSDNKGLYQIIIKEEEKTNIKRDHLKYLLNLNNEDKTEGNLSDIKDDILYTGEIDGNTKQDFKLYIWCVDEVEDDSIFLYKLDFNIIKKGGPGF